MTEKSNYDVSLVELKDIIITNAKISNEGQLSELDLTKYNIHFTYGIEIAVSEDIKNVKQDFTCRINIVDKKNISDLKIDAQFDIAFIFAVSNLKDLVDKIPPSKLDSNLITSLANIVYSTSRGIIFTRCQGTILKKVIIPILSTKDLMEYFQDRKII